MMLRQAWTAAALGRFLACRARLSLPEGLFIVRRLVP